MNKENINRLKKYLLAISIFFSVLVWGHVMYSYLYYNSIQTPIQWWSVSEWVIWDFPHLNPLKYSTDYNKNIIYQLYRSLNKYDYKQNKIVSDIADCDINDLKNVVCYINKEASWSNWDKISADDVIATYNIIQNSEVNTYIASLLKNSKIEKQDNKIVFTNKTADVNFINVLLQPIAAKSVIDNIWNKELLWKFNPLDWIYSGPYRVDTVSYDDSLWVQKLILLKNDFYSVKGENIYIEKYIYKFFKDATQFTKQKDSVDIFYDQNNVIWNSIPRLNKNGFYPNQFVSLFLNSDKIKDINLRNIILEKIDKDNILKNLWEWFKSVNNPYLSDYTWSIQKKTQNIENLLKNLWYLKKSWILWDTSTKESYTEDLLKQKLNTTLKVVNSPFNTKYFFVTNDDLTFSWPVNDQDVEQIFVNDTDIWFKKWDKTFSYNLKLDYKNIVEWENNYKVYFKKWDNKNLVDEFNVIYNKDQSQIDAISKDYFTKKASKEELAEANTQAWKRFSNISKLDDKFYYDKDYKVFSLNLLYIDNQKDLEQVALVIKNLLETYWIKINSQAISITDLAKKVSENQKDYDMILTWIDSWNFSFNISQYFHSSQAKNWYNLSNIKDPEIDSILENLKSWIKSNEDTLKLENEVIDKLNAKSVIKTLYQKENSMLIDKSIKWVNYSWNITNSLWFLDLLKNSYILTEKQIQFKDKGFKNFISFIKKVLKNDSTLEE